MRHIDDAKTASGLHVPARVVHALGRIHHRYADLDEHCRVYGDVRGPVEWLVKASRSGWLEAQIDARRTVAIAQGIAAQNGWSWTEIEGAALGHRS